MRDEIAQIVLMEMGYPWNRSDAQYTADEIITALPDMVVPLVWYANMCMCRSSGEKNYHLTDTTSGMVGLICRGSFIGSYDDDNTAKAAAQAHHVAQIMAAFRGEAND
jgi:hypothetical protein